MGQKFKKHFYARSPAARDDRTRFLPESSADLRVLPTVTNDCPLKRRFTEISVFFFFWGGILRESTARDSGAGEIRTRRDNRRTTRSGTNTNVPSVFWPSDIRNLIVIGRSVLQRESHCIRCFIFYRRSSRALNTTTVIDIYMENTYTYTLLYTLVFKNWKFVSYKTVSAPAVFFSARVRNMHVQMMAHQSSSGQTSS